MTWRIVRKQKTAHSVALAWSHRSTIFGILILIACAILIQIGIPTTAVAQQVAVREIAKITAEDGQAVDFLSFLALNRDATILVGGAIFDADRGLDAGSAYIWERDLGGANNWGLRKKLVPADLSELDLFGWDPDISGDTIAVGTRAGGLESELFTTSGAAYIFQRDSGGENNWDQVKKLMSPSGDSSDNYGTSIELEGETLVVGAGGSGQGLGEVHVYGRNQGGPDNWGLIKTITAPDGAANDQFGLDSVSIQLSGDTLLVAAPCDDDLGTDSGSVYFFERNQGGMDNWGFVKKLTAFDGVAGDQFGSGLSLSGDLALVGAGLKDDQGLDSGAAYLFERNRGGPNNWGLAKKLLPSDRTRTGDNFGLSSGLEGNIAVVAAWGNGGSSAAAKSGAVYVFHRNQGGPDNWGEVTKVEPSFYPELGFYPKAFGCCGDSPDLQSGLLAVGAGGDDQQAVEAGAIYLFELTQLPTLTIESAVIISWPIDAEGYILEAAANVDGPWNLVEAEPEMDGDQTTVVVKATQEMQWFRLRMP